MIIKSRNFDSYLNIQSFLSTASGMRTSTRARRKCSQFQHEYRICFGRVVFTIYSTLKAFNVQFIGKRLRTQFGYLQSENLFFIYIHWQNHLLCNSQK